MNKESKDIKTIVVTGFGCFRNHKLNPSWEAIKDGKLKAKNPQFKIVTELVDVSYESVDKVIPKLWEKHNPVRMVHIGLAAHDEIIRFELLARHGPYIHDDIHKHAPHKELREYKEDAISLEENVHKRNYSCKPCTFECDSTCIDVEKICRKMNDAFDKGEIVIPTRKSQEAGLYVCEYIYHKSLSISNRCIFIHIPDVKVFKLEDITKALNYAIDYLIDELTQKL